MLTVTAKLKRIDYGGIERDYPFIFVDGVRLDDLVSKVDNAYFGLFPSWIDLYDYDFDLSEKEKEYVCEKSRIDNGTEILPLLLCPDDWDFYCTVLLVEVIPRDDRIIWNKFGLDKSKIHTAEGYTTFEHDENGNPKFFEKIRWFSDLGPFIFDKKEYETCMDVFIEWGKNFKSKK